MIDYRVERRITKGRTAPCLWEPISLDKYKVKKPIMICLGGIYTTSESIADAYANMMSNLIGADEQVDVLTIIYSSDVESKKGDLTPKQVSEVVRNLLIQTVMGENYKPLPLEQAKKGMRRINFATYCHGARVVLQKIENELRYQLLNKKYSPEEVNDLLSQVFVVEYAGRTKHSSMSTFRINSLTDEVFGKEYCADYFEKIVKDRIKNDFLGKKKIEEAETSESKKESLCNRMMRKSKYSLLLKDNGMFLYTNAITKGNDHNLKGLKRDTSWKVERGKVTRKGDVVSQCMGYALAYGMANSVLNEYSEELIPLDMTMLQHDCESVLSQMKRGSKTGEKTESQEMALRG